MEVREKGRKLGGERKGKRSGEGECKQRRTGRQTDGRTDILTANAALRCAAKNEKELKIQPNSTKKRSTHVQLWLAEIFDLKFRITVQKL